MCDSGRSLMDEKQSPAAFNWMPLRILSGVLAAIPLVVAFLLIRTNIDEPFNLMGAAFLMFPITVALGGFWFACCGHRAVHRSRMKWALIGGAALGLIGFIAGFVGPITFAPEANQGPLLGIFITGPLGLFAGTWLGAGYGFFRGRQSRID